MGRRIEPVMRKSGDRPARFGANFIGVEPIQELDRSTIRFACSEGLLDN
jgi:hypothetical protein